MYFNASERLANATTDFGDLASRLDAHLKQANHAWSLDAAEIASTLRAPVDRVELLLDTAARSDVGLLTAEPNFVCPHCEMKTPTEEVKRSIESDGERLRFLRFADDRRRKGNAAVQALARSCA